MGRAGGGRPRQGCCGGRRDGGGTGGAGRIAAQIACELVCGTEPGILVTQKWVTPSST